MSAAQPQPARSLLEQIAHRDRLWTAFQHVRSMRGSAGVDGVTVAAYAGRAPDRLQALRGSLLARRYTPRPLRRALFPKERGGFRTLGIPVVEDRIVQVAASVVLARQLEPGFAGASFAYRPGRGPRDAASKLADAFIPSSWAVVADIEKFFDHVDHGILLGLLRRAGVEAAVLRLVEQWIRAPIVDRGYRLQPIRGIPQGGPISPLLANLYLDAFDHALASRSWRHVRYADDFVIVARTREDAAAIFSFAERWLREQRRLSIERSKTLYVPLSQGVAFVGFWFLPGTRKIPDDRVSRFKTRIGEILEAANRENLNDVFEAHDALVRGWRAYYEGVGAEIDGQLAELEVWREQTCHSVLDAAGIDGDVAVAGLERLSSPASAVEGPLEYSQPSPPVAGEPLDPEAEPWTGGTAFHLATPRETFSRRRPLRVQALASSQAPVLFEDGVLHVGMHGAFLHLREQLIVARKARETVFECPLQEVAHVSLSGIGQGISTRLIHALAARGSGVAVCATTGQPVARLVPARSEKLPRTLTLQLDARRSRLGARFAIAFVRAKLHNQRALLLLLAKYPARVPSLRQHLRWTAARIAEHAQECFSLVGKPCEEIRTALLLIEARASSRYWTAFGETIPAGLEFPGRRHREATDPVNLFLNYGYGVLATRVWWSIERAGLSPFLGYLHTSRHESPGLVFDLMEEFRQPVVDRTVLALLSRGARIRLRKDARLTLSTRRLLERSLRRTLERPARRARRESIGRCIRERAGLLRAALESGGRYAGYQMTW